MRKQILSCVGWLALGYLLLLLMIGITAKAAFWLDSPVMIEVRHPGGRKPPVYRFIPLFRSLDVEPLMSSGVPAPLWSLPTTQAGSATLPSAYISGKHDQHAGIYAITDLGTLGGPSSEANAINNRGQIVGKADTAKGFTHAFLW